MRITMMYFMAKVSLEDSKRWKLVNMQTITLCPHQSTVHSADLQQHTSHIYCY